MNEGRVHIPVQVIGALLFVLAVVVLLLSPARDLVRGLIPAPLSADPALVASQRAAAELAVERSYRASFDQVKRIRGFNLAITAARADAIEAKALGDLLAARRSAFTALAQVTGMPPVEVATYVPGVEARLASGKPTDTATLLAPSLYTVAVRSGELLAQIAEQASVELTGPPAGASPRPSPSPSGR